MINPFLALIARIDTDASAADPDGAGPLTSGYDSVFREPIVNLSGDGAVRVAKELTSVLIPCQFEPEDQFDALGQQAAGNDTNSRVRLVFHFSDLEELGLVDETTNDPELRLGDRLISIHNHETEALIQRCGFADGLYCVEVKPVSFGLSGGERNLLICSYNTRDSSFKAGAS